jgi:hypothetical protein
VILSVSVASYSVFGFCPLACDFVVIGLLLPQAYLQGAESLCAGTWQSLNVG